MRDRLIELMGKQFAELVKDGDWNFNDMVCNVADKLITNGVILPPVRVGQTVWFVRGSKRERFIETDIEKIVLKQGGLYMKLSCNAMYETSCNSIGKTVFLTKEEAEKALKEKENGNNT